MRIATVCGTRPELIKLAPLVPVLAERFEHTYLFTGQHYSPSMVRVFVDELEAPAPDAFLGVGHSGVADLFEVTSEALAAFQPEIVLVYGDTNSTLAGARAAVKNGTPVLHLEAGLRSFDRSMPEEMNRIEVDRCSTLRLTPTPLATWFLEALEGYPASSNPVVGNLVVDALLRHRPLADSRALPAGLGQNDEPYAVLTLHRQGTVDDPAVFERILGELASLDMEVYCPVHPRTQARLDSFGLCWPENIRTSEPVGYVDFLRAMSSAAVLLTDSGGVQEEAVCLDVPCVTLRPNTERMESVFVGANRLFNPASAEGLAEVVSEACAQGVDSGAQGNPFGDGRSAERTCVLLELIAGREPSFDLGEVAGLAGRDELEAAAAIFRGART
ncbi:MAG: UDP-N-acetylglucosamine 2-epimerase (non-hydrolyzing) [Myxococcota bacterium]|nr:UDP-N-acetylglucosamine 2-epimerase (non-hydrolyzing) [Myxococcota bacterium]